MAKWVYKFEEGNASMRNLLGGKGCNLAEKYAAPDISSLPAMTSTFP